MASCVWAPLVQASGSPHLESTSTRRSNSLNYVTNFRLVFRNPKSISMVCNRMYCVPKDKDSHNYNQSDRAPIQIYKDIERCGADSLSLSIALLLIFCVFVVSKRRINFMLLYMTCFSSNWFCCYKRFECQVVLCAYARERLSFFQFLEAMRANSSDVGEPEEILFGIWTCSVKVELEKLVEKDKEYQKL